jgi:outer membrane protein assembly factor BamB
LIRSQPKWFHQIPPHPDSPGCPFIPSHAIACGNDDGDYHHGMNRRLFALTLLFASGAPLSGYTAESWPEFRGPTGDGHLDGANVPLTWSATSNVRWKVPIPGKAWSTPAISGDHIYVTSAVVDGGKMTLEARCLNAADGSPVWNREIFSKDAGAIHKKNSHASPSPIFADNRLYVHFGHDGTACLDASNGAILWTQTSLPYAPVHGNGGSPILVDGKLIFACDGQTDPFVVALRQEDGSIAWKTPRAVTVERTFSFSTPLLIEVAGEQQVILPGSGAVVAYAPATGQELWRFRYGDGYSVVPRPVFRDGIVYVCSGFNRAILYAIKTDGKGDVTDTHLVWKDDKAVPKESSPILVDDLLYLNDDKGVLNCFEAATGAEVYRERLDGQGGYSASPVFAGGHLFFHNGDGVTTVVKPGRQFTKVGENKLGEFGLSSFAVVSDGFVIRTENHLIRIGKPL